MGQRTRVSAEERAAGYDVRREVAGHAYARNGNTHNPTPRYRWIPTFRGRSIGTCGMARHAIEIIEIHRAEGA